LKCKEISVVLGLLNSKLKMGGELLLYLENTVKRREQNAIL